MKKLFIISMFSLCLALGACMSNTTEEVTDTIITDTLTECVEDTNVECTYETPVDAEGIEIDADCE